MIDDDIVDLLPCADKAAVNESFAIIENRRIGREITFPRYCISKLVFGNIVRRHEFTQCCRQVRARFSVLSVRGGLINIGIGGKLVDFCLELFYAFFGGSGSAFVCGLSSGAAATYAPEDGINGAMTLKSKSTSSGSPYLFFASQQG